MRGSFQDQAADDFDMLTRKVRTAPTNSISHRNAHLDPKAGFLLRGSTSSTPRQRHGLRRRSSPSSAPHAAIDEPPPRQTPSHTSQELHAGARTPHRGSPLMRRRRGERGVSRYRGTVRGGHRRCDDAGGPGWGRAACRYEHEERCCNPVSDSEGPGYDVAYMG